MDDTETAQDEQLRITDRAALWSDCWAIPEEAAISLQSAAQTLGGIALLCGRRGETFASLDKVAAASLLPRKTVERHLRVLIAEGWIENLGRHHRRTCTLRLTEKFRTGMQGQRKRLFPRFVGWSWAELHVFRYFAGSQNAAAVQTETDFGSESWPDLGFELIHRRITTISEGIGLSRPTVLKAIQRLSESGVIDVERLPDGTIQVEILDAPMPQRPVKNLRYGPEKSEVEGEKSEVEGRKKRGSEVKNLRYKDEKNEVEQVNNHLVKNHLLEPSVEKPSTAPSSTDHRPALADASQDGFVRVAVERDSFSEGKSKAPDTTGPTFDDFLRAYPAAALDADQIKAAKRKWKELQGGLYTHTDAINAATNYSQIYKSLDGEAMAPDRFLSYRCLSEFLYRKKPK